MSIPTPDSGKPGVRAIQFTGENRREVLLFAYPNLSEDALVGAELMRLPVVIETSEGDVTISAGDYVIRSATGELTAESHERVGRVRTGNGTIPSRPAHGGHR